MVQTSADITARTNHDVRGRRALCDTLDLVDHFFAEWQRLKDPAAGLDPGLRPHLPSQRDKCGR